MLVSVVLLLFCWLFFLFVFVFDMPHAHAKANRLSSPPASNHKHRTLDWRFLRWFERLHDVPVICLAVGMLLASSCENQKRVAKLRFCPALMTTKITSSRNPIQRHFRTLYLARALWRRCTKCSRKNCFSFYSKWITHCQTLILCPNVALLAVRTRCQN